MAKRTMTTEELELLCQLLLAAAEEKDEAETEDFANLTVAQLKAK